MGLMMKKEQNCNELKLDVETERQIEQCLNLLKETFGKNFWGVYLYESSVFGGLQKYSDLEQSNMKLM
jgi:hypothetical protein